MDVKIYIIKVYDMLEMEIFIRENEVYGVLLSLDWLDYDLCFCSQIFSISEWYIRGLYYVSSLISIERFFIILFVYFMC